MNPVTDPLLEAVSCVDDNVRAIRGDEIVDAVIHHQLRVTVNFISKHIVLKSMWRGKKLISSLHKP